MKNNKGFSLVELLATVTIIGILSGIAVYGITRTILNSRKQIYLAAVKAQVKGVQLIINSEKYNVFDEDTVYYFDYKILKKTDDIRSPFGEWDKAYVVVTYTEKNDDEKEKLNYYWIGIDEKGWKIDLSKKVENMTIKDIYNSKDHNIEPGYTIDDREKMVLVSLDENEKEVETSGKVLNKMSLEQASTCFTYKLLSNNTYEITGYNDACSKDVDLPSSIDGKTVTSIGDAAFRKKNIQSVRMYDGIEVIKVGAFQNNIITTLKIPSTVKRIEDYAFFDNHIGELFLPEGLEYIGTYAFNQNYIKSLSLPSTVTSIGKYAFANNLIEELEFNSNPTIGTSAFSNNNLPVEQSILYKRNQDGKYDYSKIIGYCGSGGDVVIPREVNGVAPITIDSGAFASSEIESVTIPASVQTIKQDAFKFNKLTTVIFEGAEEPEESKNKEIGVYYGGKNSSLRKIAIGAFRHNKIKKIVFPETLTDLGREVFTSNEIGNSNTESGIIYGRKVGENGLGETDYTKIVSYGYGGSCDRDVKIPAYAVNIEGNTIGTTDEYKLKEIAGNAFYSSRITALTLPAIGTGDNEVKLTIGKNAFSVNKISDSTNYFIYKTENGVVDKKTLISYTAHGPNVVIPEGVERIETSFGWINMKKITLPSTVKYICDSCLPKGNKNNNVNLTTIINKTNRKFNWGVITNSKYEQDPFETGIIMHQSGNINVIKG